VLQQAIQPLWIVRFEGRTLSQAGSFLKSATLAAEKSDNGRHFV